jgi:hypothetical protein
MRRNVELDLPTRFVAKYTPELDHWLESAIPGSQFSLAVVPKGGIPLSPFVSSSSFERNVITLRAVELSSSTGPCLLIEAADAHSRRLIDQEDAKLKAAEPARQDDYSRDGFRHVGGSRPQPTGIPVTGQFGGYTGW